MRGKGGASGGLPCRCVCNINCLVMYFLPLVGILCDNYVGDASHLLSLLVINQQWKELESLFQ